MPMRTLRSAGCARAAPESRNSRRLVAIDTSPLLYRPVRRDGITLEWEEYGEPAARGARDGFIYGLLRGVGIDRSVRAALPRDVSPDGAADRAAGGGAGAAGIAGARPDGDADGPLRRPTAV